MTLTNILRKTGLVLGLASTLSLSACDSNSDSSSTPQGKGNQQTQGQRTNRTETDDIGYDIVSGGKREERKT